MFSCLSSSLIWIIKQVSYPLISWKLWYLSQTCKYLILKIIKNWWNIWFPQFPWKSNISVLVFPLIGTIKRVNIHLSVDNVISFLDRFAAFPCTKTFEKYKNMTYFTKWPQIIKIRKIKWLCTHHSLLDLVVDSTTGRWSAAKEKSGENIIFIVNFGACSFLGGDNLFLALELYPRYGLVAVEHPHGGTWCLWLRSKVGLSKNGQLEIRFVLSYLRKRNDEWTRLLL